ncbi:MAG: nucleoside hydrolase [Solobacterium sp.]|nr:nucleoside hydrolase [Solobacterium sp.]
MKLMDASGMEDVPIFRGCARPLRSEDEIIESEGCDLIIREAMKEDSRPLYVAVLGTMTDIASAINKAPEIADKLIVVFTGGQKYPDGGPEFNFSQDVMAVRKLFSSKAGVWQIPLQVCCTMEITLAQLACRVRPWGRFGRYLYGQLKEYNLNNDEPVSLRRGENWSLGDSPTAGVLLTTEWRGNFHTEKAPILNDDQTYTYNPEGKEIRVYDYVDPSMILEDFYAKLELYSEKENAD